MMHITTNPWAKDEYINSTFQQTIAKGVTCYIGHFIEFERMKNTNGHFQVGENEKRITNTLQMFVHSSNGHIIRKLKGEYVVCSIFRLPFDCSRRTDNWWGENKTEWKMILKNCSERMCWERGRQIQDLYIYDSDSSELHNGVYCVDGQKKSPRLFTVQSVGFIDSMSKTPFCCDSF